MTASRRDFLSALAATAVAPALVSLAAEEARRRNRAGRRGCHCRTSSRTPKLVESLRRGVQVMRSRPPSDPRSWIFQGAVHAISDRLLADILLSDPKVALVDQEKFWNRCPHFGANSAEFTIWHRAYLYYFERILRDAAQDRGPRVAVLGLQQSECGNDRAEHAPVSATVCQSIPRPAHQPAAKPALSPQPGAGLHQRPLSALAGRRRHPRHHGAEVVLRGHRDGGIRGRRRRQRSRHPRFRRAAPAQPDPFRGRRRDRGRGRGHGRRPDGGVRPDLLGASLQYRPPLGRVGLQQGQGLGRPPEPRLVRGAPVVLPRLRPVGEKRAAAPLHGSSRPWHSIPRRGPELCAVAVAPYHRGAGCRRCGRPGPSLRGHRGLARRCRGSGLRAATGHVRHRRKRARQARSNGKNHASRAPHCGKATRRSCSRCKS